MAEKLSYSPAQAAEYLGVTADKIREAVRAGTLPATYWGRNILIEQSDLNTFFRSLPTERSG